MLLMNVINYSSVNGFWIFQDVVKLNLGKIATFQKACNNMYMQGFK